MGFHALASLSHVDIVFTRTFWKTFLFLFPSKHPIQCRITTITIDCDIANQNQLWILTESCLNQNSVLFLTITFYQVLVVFHKLSYWIFPHTYNSIHKLIFVYYLKHELVFLIALFAKFFDERNFSRIHFEARF